jgi:hypothetical protein
MPAALLNDELFQSLNNLRVEFNKTGFKWAPFPTNKPIRSESLQLSHLFGWCSIERAWATLADIEFGGARVHSAMPMRTSQI